MVRVMDNISPLYSTILWIIQFEKSAFMYFSLGSCHIFHFVLASAVFSILIILLVSSVLNFYVCGSSSCSPIQIYSSILNLLSFLAFEFFVYYFNQGCLVLSQVIMILIVYLVCRYPFERVDSTFAIFGLYKS